jgi:hypothetical protein
MNQSVDLDTLMDDTSSEDDMRENDMLEQQENSYANYMGEN